MVYSHLAYMEAVASSLRDIKHGPSHKAFTTASGIGLLEGLMEGMTSINTPCLVGIDDCSSRLSENGADNITETSFYQFCILKNAPTTDSATQREVIRACKVIAGKVIGKMRRDKRKSIEGLTYLDISSFLIQGIGPVASGYYGCSVSFSLMEPASIAYKETDWL